MRYSNIMKHVITFKMPDAVFNATSDLPKGEADQIKEVAKKWIDSDEYVYIEIDTEAETATVLEN